MTLPSPSLSNPGPCAAPGWCPAYKRRLIGRLWELYLDPTEKGQSYRDKWTKEAELRDDKGRLPNSVHGSVTTVQIQHGPGSFFHALVKECTGQDVTSGCNCAAHIREMNVNGWLWCIQKWRTILGWVNEESDKRRAQGQIVEVNKWKCLKALVGLRKKHEAKA